MLEVSLSANNNGQWSIQPIQTLGEAEPMYVTECFRCFGTLIIWKRKSEIKELATLYLVTSWHMPPGTPRWVKKNWHTLYRELICPIQEVYEPREIHICGGKIDTPKNKWLYYIMNRKLVVPLKRMFPGSNFFQLIPDEKTNYSTLYMDEEFKVIHEQF